MTPIINPWVFYGMSVCENLGIACAIIFVFGIIAIAVCKLNSFVELEEYNPRKSTIIFLSLCLAISIFCPSENTILKMIVAQNVTYERVEVVGETVQDVYEDIISLIDGDKNEEE